MSEENVSDKLIWETHLLCHSTTVAHLVSHLCSALHVNTHTCTATYCITHSLHTLLIHSHRPQLNSELSHTQPSLILVFLCPSSAYRVKKSLNQVNHSLSSFRLPERSSYLSKPSRPCLDFDWKVANLNPSMV